MPAMKGPPPLTLIQEQVLEATARAQTAAGVDGLEGVSLTGIRRALAQRRPSAPSERYIGSIVRELREGYSPALVERVSRRPARYLATAAGQREAWRRQRRRLRLETDSRRWDELPLERDALIAFGWHRGLDGLMRHWERVDPITFEAALEECRARA